MTRFAPALAVSLLAVSATAGGAAIWDTYFAPASRASFKTVSSGSEPRIFDRDDPAAAGKLCSADGWTATFGDGGLVTVESPGETGVKTVWEFDRGRLVAHASGRSRKTVAYDTPRAAPSGVLTPLAYFEFSPEYLEEQKERVLEGKWDGTGRLRFPFENPNHSGALYCQLALLAIAAAIAFRGKTRIAASAAAAAFFVCIVLTGSRGSLVGFAAGLLPAAVFRFRAALRSRVFWISVAAAVAATACWFGLLHSDHLLRGFSGGGLGWSNAIRLDMFRLAPRMMVDAPEGWGFVGAGRAYFDWYQPIDDMYMTGSLMNDHLTTLANCGWAGRFLYFLAASLFFFLSFSFARREKSLMPASVLFATAVMSCFNPLLSKNWLLAVPAFAACRLAVQAFNVRGRRLVVLSGSSLIAAVALTLAVFCAGSLTPPPDGLRIAATGRQVRVSGMQPAAWIVDDGQGALGGIFACKDLREFYRFLPGSPSVGYVRSIKDLPERGIRRLVLSGKAANDWLLRLSEEPEARKSLPSEVTFVSPPFAPSEIPGALFHFCRVRVVVGEFAARFQPEYGKSLPFVEIVPGMERYILRWMSFAMEP